jgi:type I restriction enzyme S subunit
VPFKHLLDIQNGADHKHIETDTGFPVIGSGGPFAYASEYIYDGESVLLGRKGTIDKPLYVTGRFWTVDTMYWTKIHPAVCGKFAYYLALSIPFDYYSTNTALPSMTKGCLGSHVVAFPPLPEQAHIAAFLDRETAKIDGLVAEQQRLIVLLKEKRQAVISHAVTKGLNPAAPMKPSGIDWLGDVPAHWVITRLRFACSHIFLGLTSKVDYVDDGGVPLIRALNINGGVLDFSEVRYISHDQHQSLTKTNRAIRNDVLLSKSGSIGTAAIVETEADFSIYESIFSLRANKRLLSPRYLLHLLRSQTCSDQYAAALVGMGVGHLNMSDIINVRVALPPLQEQEQLLLYMEEDIAKFDTLTAEAQRAINLLQERRTALISAAVTGQIDVRHLAEAGAA